MLMALSEGQAPALFGAAKAVGTGGGHGDLTDASADAISSLAQLGFGVDAPDIGTLRESSPKRLTAAMADDEQCRTAAEILSVMALVDGNLDESRIGTVMDFADDLGVAGPWLNDLAASASASVKPDLEPVIADMNDHNLRSITNGQVDRTTVGDVDRWFAPYDANADEALAERYDNLQTLPGGTLGREVWSFYDAHDSAMPGRPGGVNEEFGTPHASAHLISGYDTTPQGEMLVSTFTSRMHPVFPMSGHVLPVIYSWHLGIECNALAGSDTGALDPAKFWVAWNRGRHATGDTFGDDFVMWDHAEETIDRVRDSFDVPPLDRVYAAAPVDTPEDTPLEEQASGDTDRNA
jgi:hypothetical protein